MNHWKTTDPGRYAQIPEPKEAFFQALGEQAEREIQQLEDAIAGNDPPGEDYLTKVGRLNAARQAAQEGVLSELILIGSPDSTQPPAPPKTILQDVLEAIQHADQEDRPE